MNVDGPFTASCPVVLASGSPRRQEFLRAMGVPFSVDTAGASEPEPVEGESAVAYARRAACAKTLPVARRHAAACVIGADTVVALDGVIMGKPAGHAHALSMLRALAGARHEVVSACCICLPGNAQEPVLLHAVTSVWMHRWDDAALKAYIATGEPADKAGAYGIQGIGAFLVSRIDGSWSNVVGLPLTELLTELQRRGVVVPSGAQTAEQDGHAPDVRD
ncbi:Maf family nucleotide pyrophosphatase [Oleidesulfovibrio alaskensis]|uniref:Maf family nucleotide pyrophosphatase n=1 Tax=Oleidesulfovibrio alaskensis TaxID=58180 RepID=UPI001A4F17A3|nr:Maf family nucleotide pyrophosphatase [Oleidesulfovibrio alaskensis]MBL3580970.1 septum formation protein Maf [Oleidesulfovibrio alaskensis]